MTVIRVLAAGEAQKHRVSKRNYTQMLQLRCSSPRGCPILRNTKKGHGKEKGVSLAAAPLLDTAGTIPICTHISLKAVTIDQNRQRETQKRQKKKERATSNQKPRCPEKKPEIEGRPKEGQEQPATKGRAHVRNCLYFYA